VWVVVSLFLGLAFVGIVQYHVHVDRCTPLPRELFYLAFARVLLCHLRANYRTLLSHASVAFCDVLRRCFCANYRMCVSLFEIVLPCFREGEALVSLGVLFL
jgi:hypothetical protein